MRSKVMIVISKEINERKGERMINKVRSEDRNMKK